MRQVWCSYIICFFHQFLQFSEEIEVVTAETRLHNALFPNGTAKTSFPVAHGQVSVTVGLSLNQVVDVLETEDAVLINVVVRQKWFNSDNSWNPSDYKNITRINVPPKLVWKPDLYSYANVEDDKNYNGLLDTVKTLISLHNDGSHSWNAPIILRLGCGINVKDFPFDTQVCPLRLGSVVSQKIKLIPENQSADLSSNTENSEWKLVSMKCDEELTVYNRGVESFYSDIIFELVIKRKPLFLLVNLLLPNVLLSFMTALVFFMPVKTGERVQFVVSLLLAMALFLTSAFKLMPTNSEVIPFFSYFLGTTLLAMVLLTTCLCYSLSIYYADASLVVFPTWMKKCLLKTLAPQLGIPDKILVPKRRLSKWRAKAEKSMQASKHMGVNCTLPLNHPGRLWADHERDIYQMLREMVPQKKLTHTDEILSKKGVQLLDVILKNIFQEEDIHTNQKLWMQSALTLDALFLRVFSSIYLSIIFTFALRAVIM